MIRTLLWKEYREQRMTVLALAVFAVGLLVCVQTFGYPPNSESSGYGMIAACLVWMTGLIVGAQPFAGEVENRTLAWLDSQPARRREIGRTKILFAVCATIAQTVVLIAIGVMTGWIEERYVGEALPLIVALGLSGLGCGLWGSTLGTSGLVAVGWALMIQSAVFTAAIGLALVYRTASNLPLGNGAILFAAALCLPVPFVAAFRRFTRLDRLRGKVRPKLGAAGHAWRALIWLAWRQCRLTCAVLAALGLGAAILLATKTNWQYWPPFGMAFGILAGVGAFAADRPGDAFRFIGDRRLPFGKVWLVKFGMGVAVALVPTLLFVAAILLRLLIESYYNAESSSSWQREETQQLWSGLHVANLWLAPIYGFAAGLFLGMLCRKGAVAVVLSAMIGVVALVAWWPSIVVTGLHVWQWIVPPFLLIGATRLAMRAEASGRLSAPRQAVSLTVAAGLAVAAVIGGLWYRVAEVPQRTDPFDVEVFVASLPTPEQNVTGRKLAALLNSYPIAALQQNTTLPDGEIQLSPFGRMNNAVHGSAWPKGDAELDRLVDEKLSNPWFAELREVVALPAGMVEGFGSRGYEPVRNATFAYTLLLARALQLSSRGQSAEAFDSLFVALDLSRQLRSKSNSHGYEAAASLEYSALKLLPLVVESAPVSADLLVGALERLRRHNVAVPPLGDTLRINYCDALKFMAPGAAKTGQFRTSLSMYPIAAQMPWERARTHGILATLYAGYLRTSELPYPDAIARISLARANLPNDQTFLAWTPPSIDAGEAQAELARLLNLLRHSIWWGAPLGSPDQLFSLDMSGKVHRRCAELQLALALYQLRNGKPAESLADLVPAILPELPLDPYDDKPFRYRISDGERMLKNPWNQFVDDAAYFTVATGQGVVWSIGPDRVDGGGTVNGFSGWLSRRAQADVIFLVPLLKKP